MAMKVTYNEETQRTLFHMNNNAMLASKSIMKLSSGQKINSASDNPSTFSISEKMREKIRSLDQDVLNVQNGSSMLSTAERGVSQIVEVLQSMKALAVNAADDHNNDDDRAIIQMEFESRLGTINDTVYTTKFNNKILLDGRYDRPVSHYPSTAAHIVDSFSTGDNAKTDGQTSSHEGISVDRSFIKQNLGDSIFSVKLDFSAMTAEGSSYPDALHGKGFAILCSGCTQFINVVFDATKNIYQSTYNSNPSSNTLAREYVVGVKNVTSKDELASTIFNGVAASRDFTGDSFVIEKYGLGMKRDGNDIYFTKEDNLSMQFKNDIIPTNTEPLVFVERETSSLWIQDGTLAGQQINTYIKSLQTQDLKGEIFNDADIAKLNSITDSTERANYRTLLTKADSMTLDDVSLATREDAQVAMRVIDGALDYALDEQTTLGAYVKRLNYVDENIMTKSENLQEADSKIRDTDVAKEMTKFVKYSILTQAAQFMLAQINQNGASVLNLLE